MSFRFRLQRLLELRAKAEQARARTLVDATERADDLRRQQEAVQSLRRLQRESADAAARGAITAGELQHFTYLLDQLDDRLAGATDDVQAAERVVADARAALQHASRDRRVLDRLRDRHAEQWHDLTLQHDRVEMDEVALSRYTQSRRAAGASGASGASGSRSSANSRQEPTRSNRDTPPANPPVAPGEHP